MYILLVNAWACYFLEIPNTTPYRSDVLLIKMRLSYTTIDYYLY